MIYSFQGIRDLLSSGELGISPLNEHSIGPSSIDLRLGNNYLVYRSGQEIVIGESEAEFDVLPIPDKGLKLLPGEFVLASTLERVKLGASIQGFIDTKGDVARAGVQVHSCDGHIDPGSDHTITLEISNRNSIPVTLKPGVYVCQLFVHALERPTSRPYSGKYHGQDLPTAYRTKKAGS